MKSTRPRVALNSYDFLLLLNTKADVQQNIKSWTSTFIDFSPCKESEEWFCDNISMIWTFICSYHHWVRGATAKKAPFNSYTTLLLLLLLLWRYCSHFLFFISLHYNLSVLLFHFLSFHENIEQRRVNEAAVGSGVAVMTDLGSAALAVMLFCASHFRLYCHSWQTRFSSCLSLTQKASQKWYFTQGIVMQIHLSRGQVMWHPQKPWTKQDKNKILSQIYLYICS